MDTDITTMVIVIIASSTFLVPIGYFEFYKKRAANKFAATFKKVSKNNSLNLTQYDVWNDHYGIGIDAAAKKMIYHNQKNGQAVTVVHDLPQIKRCRVVKVDTHIMMPDGDRSIPTRVNLQMEFLSPEKKPVSVEFYKGEIGDYVRDEVLLAEKWTKIINSKSKNS